MAEITASSICLHRFERCALFVPILIVLLAAAGYSQQMATVIRPNATLHGTPVSAGKVITSLEKGAKVEILISQGTWRLVQSHDYVGWISNGAIQADDDPQNAILPVATPVTLKSTMTPPPASTIPVKKRDECV